MPCTVESWPEVIAPGVRLGHRVHRAKTGYARLGLHRPSEGDARRKRRMMRSRSSPRMGLTRAGRGVALSRRGELSAGLRAGRTGCSDDRTAASPARSPLVWQAAIG